ncbi:MAG: hypothetical protein OXC31_26570 [Spirochaetaceae bacterium]|nr:hypothetical protein [Spirochaetaceae bacterium]
MLREAGVDISALPMEEALRHIADAEALRDMRVEELAAGVERGIAAAFKG